MLVVGVLGILFCLSQLMRSEIHFVSVYNNGLSFSYSG